jgi:PAS domain S-box-containing protein
MEITKLRMQFFATSEQLSVRLLEAQAALIELRKKFRRLLLPHTRENILQNLHESSPDAVTLAHNNTNKFRLNFRAALEQVTVHLRKLNSTLAKVRVRVVEKPRKLQVAIRERENDLPRLLEMAPDAMVVMNTELRFVAANPKALDVFGISETNMPMFSMDAFLPRRQILCFDEDGAPLISRKEWHGECRIRRLDGSLRIAEYIFVANYLPFRHLCMFRNDRKWARAKGLVA